jgi:hypothetical protein
MVWDNALNGQRGSGLAEQDAHDQAAELELQYDARGYRSAETVQRVDPPAFTSLNCSNRSQIPSVFSAV